MRKKIWITVIICSIIAAVKLFPVSFAASESEKKKKDDLFRSVELFSDAVAIIRSEYVDEKPSKDLIYGALKGMLSSLDPHSQFMDPETYQELKVDTEGKFGGLGIEITIKDGLLTVITPIEDTPAWKAGLKANDRIVKINDALTRDITLTDAVKKLRGKPGEAVTLSVLRESEKKIMEFKIVRDIIKIKDIKDAKILEDGIAYIRLVEFREDTVKQLNIIFDSLKKQGMNALIIDLRNNPGGLLDVAFKVTEKFVETGKMVVYTKGRKSGQNLEFIARERNPDVNLPLAILINEGSASGSEIVAGCLQDYKRAIIIGTKSFGKGSVQTVIPMVDGSALRLTTSKYFTPSGREIHGKGIIPDIEVEDGKIKLSSEDEIKEDNKDKAVQVFDEIEKKEEPADKESEEKEAVFDYKSDNQLMRAVDVLKAVKILKK